MRTILLLCVSIVPCALCAAEDADIEQLMVQSDPVVHEQIARTLAALGRTHLELDGNVRAFEELQKLKDTVAEDELVKQLAIFAATPADEQRPLAAVVILGHLRIPHQVTIRALAPYLGTADPQLHSFLYDIFRGIDHADSGPFKLGNFYDYLEYIRVQVDRNEEIPDSFVKYIYERSPGQALAVFNSATVNVSDEILLLNKARERAQQGRAPTEQERAEVHRVKAERQQEKQERRKIVLAEHIISNALWLKKHGFDERFQATMPEAMAELEKLAKHEEWWARMYVVYIMRQNLVLRRDHILRQLAEDENELVREAAKR
jgi:hypothetical protein